MGVFMESLVTAIMARLLIKVVLEILVAEIVEKTTAGMTGMVMR